MKRVLPFLLPLLLIAVAYVASPFHAAWVLREAIATRDTPTIERKIVWDSVRTTLKESIVRNAQLLPEVTAAGEAIQPTLWQRFEYALGATMVDRFVEAYVTPEGLPKLMALHRARAKLAGKTTALSDNTPPLDRLKAFYARVKRAEFKSPISIEFEILDEFNPAQRTVSLFHLSGTEWQLAELRVFTSAKPAPATTAAAQQSTPTD